MSSRGERHDSICYDFICSGYFLVCSDFLLPYLLPLSHVRFRGRKTSKGRKSLEFIAYLYSWGHVNIQIEYLVLTLYMSSQSWYSCDLLFLLCLVDVLVLSNLVYPGTSLSQLAQAHKGRIGSPLLGRKISCYGMYMPHTHVHEDLLLVYILFARETHEHEGIFPASTSFALMHIAKTHVTHCLL